MSNRKFCLGAKHKKFCKNSITKRKSKTDRVTVAFSDRIWQIFAKKVEFDQNRPLQYYDFEVKSSPKLRLGPRLWRLDRGEIPVSSFVRKTDRVRHFSASLWRRRGSLGLLASICTSFRISWRRDSNPRLCTSF